MADAPTYVNYQTGQPGPIVGSSIADGSISTAQLADGAVTNVKITVSAVSSGNIITGTIIATNIANNGVTNAKLATQSAATFKGRGFGSADGTPTNLSKNEAITIITSGGADEISQSGNRWGVITYIASDGVMEVGKYLDFHNSDASTSDYAVRVQSTGTTGLVLNQNAVFGRFLLTANSVANGTARLLVTFGGTFDNYYLKARVTPIPDNDVPVMRFIQSGASVANTSSYGWAFQFGTIVSGTMAEGVVRIGGNTGSVSPTEFCEVEMKFTRMNQGTLAKVVTWVGVNINGTPAIGSLVGGGVLTSNTATVEGAVLFYGLGSIKTGIYWLYGDMGTPT